MKFADFRAGQVIPAGSYAISEEEILAYARQWDPQWFHTDPERAETGRWDGLIASGWQTCGVAMRLAVLNVLEGSESFGSPGVKHIRWPHPVRPGDVLHLHIEVLDARTSSSRPDLGILTWRWLLTNQDGRQVLELEAASLFDLSASSHPPPAAAR